MFPHLSRVLARSALLPLMFMAGTAGAQSEGEIVVGQVVELSGLGRGVVELPTRG